MIYYGHEQVPIHERQEGLPGIVADRMARKAAHQQQRIHRQLENPDYAYEYTWAFHDSEEIGPVMLAKIAKHTGLKPEDL